MHNASAAAGRCSLNPASIIIFCVHHSCSLVSFPGSVDRDSQSILNGLADRVCNHPRNEGRDRHANLLILIIYRSPEFQVVGNTLYACEFANSESVLSVYCERLVELVSEWTVEKHTRVPVHPPLRPVEESDNATLIYLDMLETFCNIDSSVMIVDVSESRSSRCPCSTFRR